jgi:hypothetical protein
MGESTRCAVRAFPAVKQGIAKLIAPAVLVANIDKPMTVAPGIHAVPWRLV